MVVYIALVQHLIFYKNSCTLYVSLFIFFESSKYSKEKLEDTKGQSEAINHRKTDKTMTKRKVGSYQRG